MEPTRAERLIEAAGTDAVVISNGTEPFLDSAFWYLTGLDSGTFEGSFAVVSRERGLHVIVSKLEEEAAKRSRGEVTVYSTGRERDDAVKKAIGSAGRIGIPFDSTVHSMFAYISKMGEGAEISNISPALGEVRSVKDREEISRIEAACAISSKVASEIPGMLREKISEEEAAARMDSRMRELGASGNAFETIAAFGPASAEPHHRPTGYRLKKGDVALFDFGAKRNMYCSDLTRTVFLGDPDPRLLRAYEVVLEAQRAGIEAIKDGVQAKEPDAAARDVIEASEFRGMFIHSFGHGIGMDVHEPISLSPRSENVLKAGNVVSAEPGVYISGVGGIRIEDTVLVTENGCRRLTDFDRSVTIIR
ncbi:MAG: Xaa-Pro peptidase family protein [Candidatus Methanomethylophilaceae archaeon]